MDLSDVISKEVDDRVQWLKNSLATGQFDHDDYRAICGEIKGLLHVKQYVLDLKKQLENSDEWPKCSWLKQSSRFISIT